MDYVREWASHHSNSTELGAAALRSPWATDGKSWGGGVEENTGQHLPLLCLFLHSSPVDLLLVLLETGYRAREPLVQPLAAVPIMVSLV